MAAFVGWLVAVSGIHFPGLCSFSEGVSFEDLSKLAPLEQWSAVRRTSNPRRRLLSLGTAPGRTATGPTSGAPELAQRAGAPLAAQLPALGKAQILLAIGIIEHQSEWKIKPHYMKVRRTPPLRRTPWLAARAAPQQRGAHLHRLTAQPAGPAGRRARQPERPEELLGPGRVHQQAGCRQARAAAPLRDQEWVR
eukprot:Transcript_3697.p1 GENE.Transcript_3697~~Transcript_3697.p1  ORF type:complete len:194 (-),score=25.01 Transcript_3697:219-800(-)